MRDYMWLFGTWKYEVLRLTAKRSVSAMQVGRRLVHVEETRGNQVRNSGLVAEIDMLEANLAEQPVRREASQTV